LAALISNILLIGVFFFGKPDTLALIIIVVAIAAALFFSLYKAQQSLTTIGIRANKNIDIPLLVLLAAGFPFYFLFYIYNRILVNQLISESNTTV
jgi:lipopolysaccharide export system permease protein